MCIASHPNCQNSEGLVAMSLSIGIIGSLAVPVVAYLAYVAVRAHKGAVPKNWWDVPHR
jgi:hypothetical protein